MSFSVLTFTDEGLPIKYEHSDLPIITIDNEGEPHEFESSGHWHNAMEFFYIQRGSMEFSINGEIVQAEKGQGVFINSRRVHYGYVKNKNCSNFVILIDLSAFEKQSPLAAQYMKRKFGLNAVDHLTFDPSIPWEKEVLELLFKLHDNIQSKELNPFKTMSLASGLIALVGEHISNSEEKLEGDKNKIAFLNMTGFIGNHYHMRLSIDDIAAAGGVCRSKCCQIFKAQIKQSPNNYLIHYRIAKSCDLLKNTDTSIGEIALKCGFQSASYFTNVFQKHTGLSPRQYRYEEN